jgi:hypothetical protein
MARSRSVFGELKPDEAPRSAVARDSFEQRACIRFSSDPLYNFTDPNRQIFDAAVQTREPDIADKSIEPLLRFQDLMTRRTVHCFQDTNRDRPTPRE